MTSKSRKGRHHRRMLCASLITVVPADGAGFGRSMVGVVEDISERGVCVSLEEELRLGHALVLLGVDHKIPAVVRHCKEDEGGMFHVGVEFALGHAWLPEEPWPEHRAPRSHAPEAVLTPL